MTADELTRTIGSLQKELGILRAEAHIRLRGIMISNACLKKNPGRELRGC